MKMKQLTVLENGNKAVYTYLEKSDSQGYHIQYRGPRGTFTTTHLGFYSVIKDCLKRGSKIVESTFDNLEEVVEKVMKDIAEEEEINERWQKQFGHNCVLI
jgi:hypothetical protein